jgi:hypothetical protein
MTHAVAAGPYYPLGTIGTAPRSYDIFRAYAEMEGRKIKFKKLENLIHTTSKIIFLKLKFHYKPTCEVGNV